MVIRNTNIVPEHLVHPSTPEEIIDISWNMFRYWRAMPIPVVSKDIGRVLYYIMGRYLRGF